MKESSNNNVSGRTWFLMPLIAVSIAFGYLTLSDRFENAQHQARIKLQSGQQGAGNQKFNDLSLSLLTDSILSIVQSYYVDQPRVKNEDLLKITFESLGAVSGIETGLKKSTVSSVWIKIDGNERVYKIKRPYSYSNLLSTFRDVASFIDGSGVEISLSGDNPKSQSGSRALHGFREASYDDTKKNKSNQFTRK